MLSIWMDMEVAYYSITQVSPALAYVFDTRPLSLGGPLHASMSSKAWKKLKFPYPENATTFDGTHFDLWRAATRELNKHFQHSSVFKRVPGTDVCSLQWSAPETAE